MIFTGVVLVIVEFTWDRFANGDVGFVEFVPDCSCLLGTKCCLQVKFLCVLIPSAWPFLLDQNHVIGRLEECQASKQEVRKSKAKEQGEIAYAFFRLLHAGLSLLRVIAAGIVVLDIEVCLVQDLQRCTKI